MTEPSTERSREPAAAVVRPSAVAPLPTPEPATPPSQQQHGTRRPAPAAEQTSGPYYGYYNPYQHGTPGPAPAAGQTSGPYYGPYYGQYQAYLPPPVLLPTLQTTLQTLHALQAQAQEARRVKAAHFSRNWRRAAALSAASAACSAVLIGLAAGLSFGPLPTVGARSIYWAGPLGLLVIIWDAYTLVRPWFRPRRPGVAAWLRVIVDFCGRPAPQPLGKSLCGADEVTRVVSMAGTACIAMAVLQVLSASRAAGCQPRNNKSWLNNCSDAEYELQQGGAYYYRMAVAILAFILLIT